VAEQQPVAEWEQMVAEVSARARRAAPAAEPEPPVPAGASAGPAELPVSAGTPAVGSP